MVRTRVGYAGGSQAQPTYHNIGDHAETVQMDFDPQKISFEQLLDIYWDLQSPPTSPSYSSQYQSILFYHDEKQRALAEQSLRRIEARLGKKVYVAILPDDSFHLAEAYHQKYYLRSNHALLNELLAQYSGEEWVNSSAAARLNGVLGGNGSLEQVKRELNSYGLSAAGQEKLLRIAQQRLR